MNVIETRELEHLVRATFPQKRLFSVDTELGLAPHSRPVVAFVHSGGDPLLDRQFDAWLDGSAAFVAVYQLLNRLCRAGALKPGDYAVRRSRESLRPQRKVVTPLSLGTEGARPAVSF